MNKKRMWLGPPPSQRRMGQQIDEAVDKVSSMITSAVHHITSALRCSMSPNVTDVAIRRMVLRAWDDAVQRKKGQEILLTRDSQDTVLDLAAVLRSVLDDHETLLDMTDPGNLKFARELVVERVGLALRDTRSHPEFQGRKMPGCIRVVKAARRTHMKERDL